MDNDPTEIARSAALIARRLGLLADRKHLLTIDDQQRRAVLGDCEMLPFDRMLIATSKPHDVIAASAVARWQISKPRRQAIRLLTPLGETYATGILWALPEPRRLAITDADSAWTLALWAVEHHMPAAVADLERHAASYGVETMPGVEMFDAIAPPQDPTTFDQIVNGFTPNRGDAS